MSVDKVISDWRKKAYKPVYWIEGDEDFYVDQLVNYAEQNILSESEASFNLTVFYGKDAAWPDVLNACKKYPMFSDRQVVIIKEAQQMRDVDKLESYIQSPLSSTILLVAFKDKKLDSRTKFAKLVKDKAEYILTKKLYENALPEWVNTVVSTMGYSISPKANSLLVDHIGNDLSRIKNELDKILINLGSRKAITEEDVENYVGISKEFNVFELQNAIATRNLAKAIRIIQYFEANPKVAPIQLVLPSLYSFFNKVYMVFGASGGEDGIAKQIGVGPYFVKSYLQATKTYSFSDVEKILLLLHNYNLKSLGIGAARIEDAELMKELVVKVMM
ncbi:DNA polymerase III subunit delta [Niabella ginsengisoli]|uniref:DNA polymerase III subunit delta n=1 Tax=Niabella ginsengisoli TaxID=522298 RepID=A0ABS9SH20_9BACT|nr:DNA polymerase III subunit delta [Niabella ginsengisoli]MCH5597454.1 DNA polymerase III subunit delta [Niabella ginsengisoli]